MISPTMSDLDARFDFREGQSDSKPKSGMRLTAGDLTLYSLAGLHRTLYRADRAFRANRALQKMMRFDPDIIFAMKLREHSIALLPWRIEADEEDDPEAQAKAACVEAAIRRTKNLRQLIENLAKGYWYGSTAANIHYTRYDQPAIGEHEDKDTQARTIAKAHFGPEGWTPLHPDSLLFDVDGRLVLRTNIWTDTFKEDQRIQTPEGYGVLLTPAERAATVLHVWGIEPPEFDDYTTAARMFEGHGLRSLLWFGWEYKQLTQQHAAHYAERLARGTVIAKNAGGKAEDWETVLERMFTHYAVVVPWQQDGPQDPIDVLEPSGTGHQIFTALDEAWSKKIVKAILGQELVTETAPTGMGSGIGEQHRQTFDSIIRHDALCLEDSLTTDLVGPIERANFGDGCGLRFKFILPEDDIDAETVIERAKALAELGVEMVKDEIREKAGFKKPKPDEEVIGAAPTDGGLGDLLGSFDITGGAPGAPGAPPPGAPLP